jgi:hypothetical protein
MRIFSISSGVFIETLMNSIQGMSKTMNYTGWTSEVTGGNDSKPEIAETSAVRRGQRHTAEIVGSCSNLWYKAPRFE